MGKTINKKNNLQSCAPAALTAVLGLRNAREVALLWDYVPKMTCTAEQALTRSHLTHSVVRSNKGF